ncbi:hypothetical protein VTO42DRAFT_8196 [Malbranchea cinnamomea]
MQNRNSSSISTADIPLFIALQPINSELKPDEPCTLDIAVQNTDGNNSVLTFLTWDTPLDPHAGVLGVFEIHDEDDPSVKINTQIIAIRRKLPPPPEDFVEIAAQQTLSARVMLDQVDLPAGRRYAIRAKGWWQAVWEATKEEVLADAEKAEQLSGGAMSGVFVSESVIVSVVRR